MALPYMIATLQQINIAMAKIVFPRNLSAHGGFLHSFASLLEAIIIALAIGWATHDGMMMTMTMMTTMTMMMCLEPKNRIRLQYPTIAIWVAAEPLIKNMRLSISKKIPVDHLARCMQKNN